MFVIEGRVESLNFSTFSEGDCKMKYIFRPLIVVAVCCAGLFLSGYSYADGRSERYNNGWRNYNDVNRYQKYEQHKGHHCEKRDCKRCKKSKLYVRNRQNRQNYFSLRNNRPYFYFSFGRNDDRFRYGRWKNGFYCNDSYKHRHGRRGY